MKKLIILLFVGALVLQGRQATAQELLIPPADSPQLELPSEPEVGSGNKGSATKGSATRDQLPSSTEIEPIPAGDLSTELPTLAAGEEYAIFDHEPALLESTGTWLRRGFWFAEFDAVIFDRIFRRDDLILLSQGAISNGIIAPATPLNTLSVNGGSQGAEAAPRLKLGRFLFRDSKNRDHTTEFIVYGGGQWSQAGAVAPAAGGLTTDLVIAQGTGAFDSATASDFEYNSRFNDFELNYHVKSRLRKDRMELEPSGQWVRRAQPTVSRSLLVGLRFFDLNEDFNWNASGINAAGVLVGTGDGVFNVRTDNDLIGAQVGGSLGVETSRWSLSLENKSGLYLSRSNVDSAFDVGGAGALTGNNSIEEDNIAFVLESAVVGRWHLRPNFSLRLGLEAMYISDLALAPNQLNFTPVATSQSIGIEDNIFLGGLIGFEGYW